MTLYVSQTLEDGSQVVADADDPNVTYVLKPGQFDEIDGLPESEQRHRLREFMAMNKTEWEKERGPDSDLGKNLEAGTPRADHSSEGSS